MSHDVQQSNSELLEQNTQMREALEAIAADAPMAPRLDVIRERIEVLAKAGIVEAPWLTHAGDDISPSGRYQLREDCEEDTGILMADLDYLARKSGAAA